MMNTPTKRLFSIFVGLVICINFIPKEIDYLTKKCQIRNYTYTCELSSHNVTIYETKYLIELDDECLSISYNMPYCEDVLGNVGCTIDEFKTIYLSLITTTLLTFFMSYAYVYCVIMT
jgi:hypothetical protein